MPWGAKPFRGTASAALPRQAKLFAGHGVLGHESVAVPPSSEDYDNGRCCRDECHQVAGLSHIAGGSVNEEFGWAYAIDRLRQGRPLLWATVLLGIIWGCWHIPLFFVTGLTQSYVPFWAFLIFTVALRVLIVWGYESNDRSILVALLFHTASNLSFNLYNVVDRSPQRDERGLIWWTLLMGLVAIVVALSARCYRHVPVPMHASA